MHFKSRLWERYNLNINKREHSYLTRQCQRLVNTGDHISLTNTRSGIVLEFKRKKITVIFDRSRASIVTVLPGTKPDHIGVLHG
jgi:hypothetical protein